MSQTLRTPGLLPLAALAGLTVVVLWSADAQQPKGEQAKGEQPKGEDGKTKRLAYAVRYGSAKELAVILGKYFKGDAEVQAVDGSGNLLLINTNAAIFDELLATLAKLDRRPKTLSVEVFVIELPPKKGEGGKFQPADKDVDEKEFTGTIERVATNIAALQKKGTLGTVNRFTLTALENQTAHALNGGTKPYVAGITNIGGKSRTTITYRNLGTSVTVTAKVGEGAITLDLTLDDVRMVQPEDGIALGMDDQGRTIMATEFATAKLNANVSVAAGQAVLVEGVQVSGKAGNSRTLVVVGAKVMP
jgi:type II secretory pathway component GspD/PulD (secretin)